MEISDSIVENFVAVYEKLEISDDRVSHLVVGPRDGINRMAYFSSIHPSRVAIEWIVVKKEAPIVCFFIFNPSHTRVPEYAVTQLAQVYFRTGGKWQLWISFALTCDNSE